MYKRVEDLKLGDDVYHINLKTKETFKYYVVGLSYPNIDKDFLINITLSNGTVLESIMSNQYEVGYVRGDNFYFDKELFDIKKKNIPDFVSLFDIMVEQGYKND